ncbi:unknown [Crocosphaera subtropica ATCC 51142]|uniref:Uncharacterized protein n=1 Tax=Crocosphaera subtropica (strain ATCC 51142 / BH68) TaxID=43989 RepID=B1WVM2_CROS5|nr:hypothetical protein [Crocosphaera subtropica]ACB50609.1 unknown [Crocosphaera subtropica ATCC 51142]
MKQYRKLLVFLQLPTIVTFSWSFLSIPVNAQGSTIACFEYVQGLGANRETAQSICASYPQYAGYCADKVRSIGGTWETAESLCQDGTRFSGQCFIGMRAQGATWEHSESLCKNATANTSQCVQQARGLEGFSWKGALQECRPPQIADALQNCINSLTHDLHGNPTGISPEAASQECSRGR